MPCKKAVIMLICATAGVSAPAAAAPDVVATIAPIHSLVAAVMADAGTPTLLLSPNASPHSYALKPSDAKALNDAEIVFWVGEGLETFMQRPLRALATDARIVSLTGAPGVALLPVRAAGIFEDRDHEKPDASDPHIWLNPANAQRIVDNIVTTLAEMDAPNSALYRRNGDQLQGRIQDLSARISAQLAPVRGQPYIVFHDAYQYFEQGFDLRPTGSITLDPGQPASAARIATLTNKVAELEIRCLFSEPQFKPDIVNALRDSTDTRVSELDSLGSKFPAGPDQYFDMMQDMANSFADCLTP